MKMNPDVLQGRLDAAEINLVNSSMEIGKLRAELASRDSAIKAFEQKLSALRAQNAELREALEKIANYTGENERYFVYSFVQRLQEIARAVLAKEQS